MVVLLVRCSKTKESVFLNTNNGVKENKNQQKQNNLDSGKSSNNKDLASYQRQ